MVLQMLAARLFNSGASAMKLLMGGFYQTAVMVMRDILETTFLLDYFPQPPRPDCRLARLRREKSAAASSEL